MVQSLLYGVRMVYSYIAERKKGTLAEDRDASKGVDPFFEKPFFQKKNFLIPEVQR